MASKKKLKKNELDTLIAKIVSHQPSRIAATTKDHSMFFSVYFGPDYIQYASADLHHAMFAITEDESIKLAVITAFRSSGKSTICSTSYPLWAILGKQQKKFVLLLGQTQQKAQQLLDNVKHVMEPTEILRADLGPFQEERSQWCATALVISRFGAKIMIASAEQSVRGLRHRQYRPDLIIVDDIEDLESVKTKEGRDKTWDWLVGDVFQAGDDRRTKIIVVGNHLHEDSVLKRLEAHIATGNVPGAYRRFPIVNENGVSLWPARYPDAESIDEKRRGVPDEVTWHREYMLTIISTSERVVQPEWIHYYDELPLGNPRLTAFGIDLAVSEKASADCTAIVIGYLYGQGDDAKIYILPYPVNERLAFPDQVSRIKALREFHLQKCWDVKIYVEAVAYQQALVQLLESYRYDVEAVPAKGGDKAARLRFATPYLKEGKVLFPRKGCEVLIAQLVGFGKEKHDDLADAFAYLVIKTAEKEMRPQAVGYSSHVDTSDLQHLNPRAQFVEMEKRRRIADSLRRL